MQLLRIVTLINLIKCIESQNLTIVFENSNSPIFWSFLIGATLLYCQLICTKKVEEKEEEKKKKSRKKKKEEGGKRGGESTSSSGTITTKPEKSPDGCGIRGGKDAEEMRKSKERGQMNEGRSGRGGCGSGRSGKEGKTEKDEKDTKQQTKQPKFDKITIEKHKLYMQEKKKFDVEAENIHRFKKMGKIHIPCEPTNDTFLQNCTAPNDIKLDIVYFDDKLNEIYDIGTDIDDIELDDSTIGSTMTPLTNRSSASENHKKTTKKIKNGAKRNKKPTCSSSIYKAKSSVSAFSIKK